MTRPISALFTANNYGFTIPPSELPGRAVREFDRPIEPEVTEENCRTALAESLSKGWLQIIDEAARTRIADELRKGQVCGPIYGGVPEVGSVDFTEAGAELWRLLRKRRLPARRPFAYTDIVREKTTRFFRSSTAAQAAIDECRAWDDVVAIDGPIRIGPWRAHWWRRFPEGYRVEIEQRRQWWGLGSGGDECYLSHPAQKIDASKLRHILDSHNVTFAEWLVLQCMEINYSRASPAQICHEAAASAHQQFDETITQEQCGEALEACLRYEWLRVIDQRVADEVQSLLDHDPAVLAVPRIAEHRPRECLYAVDPRRPDQLSPRPLSPSHLFGTIDFSPVGAALYRMIAAEWLGPDWEDHLVVSHVTYWEEHHYCESEEGFQRIVEEHVAKGDCLQASRTAPIGPWCVYWWERFPAGFRLELQFFDS